MQFGAETWPPGEHTHAESSMPDSRKAATTDEKQGEQGAGLAAEQRGPIR